MGPLYLAKIASLGDLRYASRGRNSKTTPNKIGGFRIGRIYRSITVAVL